METDRISNKEQGTPNDEVEEEYWNLELRFSQPTNK
jgi:hypothetical protein